MLISVIGMVLTMEVLMKHTQKVTMLVLTGIITASSLIGCSGNNKGANNESAQVATEAQIKDLSKEIVLTVGKVEVSYEEILLYIQSNKEQYENLYGKDIWNYKIDEEGNTFESLFKENLLKDIEYVKIVCAQAKGLNISLTEDELLDVDEQTSDFFSNLSEEQLSYYNIDSEVVKKIYTENMLANKVYESLTLSVDTEVSDEEARQVKLQYFLIQNYSQDENGNPISYTEEQKETAKKKAEELRANSLTVEDFGAFARENTEADEIEITAGKGDLDSELVKVAFSMKQGDISEVVETKEGYYVLYCVLELDREATDEAKEALIAKRQEEAFDTRYEEWSKSIEIILNKDLWESITLEDSVAE